MAGVGAAQIYDQLKKVPKAKDTSVQGLDWSNWLSGLGGVGQAFTAPFAPAVDTFTQGDYSSVPGALGTVGRGGLDILGGFQDLLINNPANYLESIMPLGTPQQFGENFLRTLGGERAPTEYDSLVGAPGVPPAPVGGPQDQPQPPGPGAPPPWTAPGAPQAPQFSKYINNAFGVPPMEPTAPTAPTKMDYINNILMGIGSQGDLPNRPHELGSLLFQLGAGAMAGALGTSERHKQALEGHEKDLQDYTAAFSKFTSDREQSLADAAQTEFQNQIQLGEYGIRKHSAEEMDKARQRGQGTEDATPMLSQLATLDPEKMYAALTAVDPGRVMKILEGMGKDITTLSGFGLDKDMTSKLAYGKVLQVLRLGAQDDPDDAALLMGAEAYARAMALTNGRR